MGYWSTRGLRGSTFEEMINITNDFYKDKGLAIIQKIPTPITPIELNRKTSTISLAYFDKKSTVDFIGAVQGIPICFDAKETTRKSLPMQNIHEHQMEFMECFQKQGGLSFLLVQFKFFNEIYYLPYSELKKHWDIAQNGGRKSIAYDDFDKELIVVGKGGFVVHYLEAISKILSRGE